MTGEEAIKVLMNTEDNINYDKRRDEIYFTHEWVGAYEMAISALREQPRWIPVAERLPEANVPVLTLGRRKGIGIGYVTNFSRSVGKVYFYARYGDHLPTHWMPLPKEEV